MKIPSAYLVAFSGHEGEMKIPSASPLHALIGARYVL